MLEIAQSRSYLHTLGLKVGIIYILGAQVEVPSSEILVVMLSWQHVRSNEDRPKDLAVSC